MNKESVGLKGRLCFWSGLLIVCMMISACIYPNAVSTASAIVTAVCFVVGFLYGNYTAKKSHILDELVYCLRMWWMMFIVCIIAFFTCAALGYITEKENMFSAGFIGTIFGTWSVFTIHCNKLFKKESK